MAGISSKALKPKYAQNNYKYNGKELQNQEFSDGTGLENYDFGARMYDPQIGRWYGIDLLSEKFSNVTPYCYVENNPLSGIDPDGNDVIFLNSTSAVIGGGIIGHGAVIIGNDKDGWSYYSMNGTGENGQSGTMYGDSKNPDVGTDLGHGNDSRSLIINANTINPKEQHSYDRFIRIKTTQEEDKLMKIKAAAAASARKYFVIGSSCIDVQKNAWSALVESRVGDIHSLIAQSALRIDEPNAWLTNLPYAISNINFYVWISRGSNYISSPKKPVIEILPLKDITPKN